jgi:hypothetical protein
VSIACVVTPGCDRSADGAGDVHRAPRDVEAHGAQDLAGAPALGPEVSYEAGAPAIAPSGKQPPRGAAGEGGASALGDSSELPPEGSAGEASLGGAPTVIAAPPPSCGKQQEGTLCGANMVPAGADGMRYFCSDGEVLAQARCPAACDVETNACEQSGGTGSGSGETNLHIALRCPECYATSCRAELVACQASARCVAHLACVESCSIENECFTICDGVFSDEALFGDLDKCAEQTGCAAHCQVEGSP